MSKSWDVLRSNSPLLSGEFELENNNVYVKVDIGAEAVGLGLGPESEIHRPTSSQYFEAPACRELAEFLIQLADQLEAA